MIKRAVLAGSIFGFMAAAGAVSAAETSGGASLLTQADAAYAKRSDLPEAKIALVYYEKAAHSESPSGDLAHGDRPVDESRKAEPRQGRAVEADSVAVEACWKAARAAWWIGDHASERAEKLRYFQKGIDDAKEALARNPGSVDAHFWLGGNDGSYGEARGILKSLFLIKPIRHEMAEVIRLDDRYNGGGGYRVLGALDFKVPGFAGGSKKRALEELSKALAMDAQNPFTRYYLADYFLSVGDKDKAREELQALQSLAPEPDLEPELRMMQQKSKKLAEKL